ncbi:hypothetical protein PAE9249_00923 [Paenibacillus sp. CECT 9249]|nr:hypothetical protein PAE9249_00923 [Paenibacillus sp. CECT 9249]
MAKQIEILVSYAGITQIRYTGQCLTGHNLSRPIPSTPEERILLSIDYDYSKRCRKSHYFFILTQEIFFGRI